LVSLLIKRRPPGLLQSGCSNCTNRQCYQHFTRLNNYSNWKIWDIKHLCPMTQKLGQLSAMYFNRNTNKQRSSSEEQERILKYELYIVYHSKFMIWNHYIHISFVWYCLQVPLVFSLLYYRFCQNQISSFYSNIYPTRRNVTQFIISGNCSTCFGWYLHPSSGAYTTVSTESDICHTVMDRVKLRIKCIWRYKNTV